MVGGPRHFMSGLTAELSGRPPPPLRIGEHAIHCEHDAPTMIHGPFQRIASGLIYKSSPYQGNALHAIHANATQCSFTDFSGVSPLRSAHAAIAITSGGMTDWSTSSTARDANVYRTVGSHP